MRQCSVYCADTAKDAVADILEQNDKRIKVAMVGMNMTITLTRKDKRQPYIGFAHGLEFETFGELD